MLPQRRILVIVATLLLATTAVGRVVVSAFQAPPTTSSTSARRQHGGTTTSWKTTTTTTQLLDSTTSIQDLPTPPKKGGLFRRFLDTFAYLKNSDDFIQRRSEELDSNIFEMYQFFRPTVVVGGQEYVKEFIQEKEKRNSVIFPALPDSFLQLHTKWGTLNMDVNDILFKQSRELFKDVLASPEALSYHTQTILPVINEYVNELVRRVEESPADQEFQLVPEILELCLQMFSKIFSGQGLSNEQVEMFLEYNQALLSLSTNSEQYKNGKRALDTLKVEMICRFQALTDDDDSLPMDAPGKFYHSKVYGREGFDNEDRIGTGMVLFVWGAYVECASLMLDALALMHKYGDGSDNDEIRHHVVAEYHAAKKEQQQSDAAETDYKFWTSASLPYTVGVLRETLRLEPPGAGVPRFSPNDFSLGGYRIPANVPVMLDPGIGNNDPNLYQEPTRFEPLRWTSETTTTTSSSKCPFAGSALKLGPGSWFPGGNGAHKCPGVPLAEIVSAIFVAKVAEKLTWKFSGTGLTSDNEIDYVRIPVKILPDNFGFYFEPVPQQD